MGVGDLLKTSPTTANERWLSDELGSGWEVGELGNAGGSKGKQCMGELKKAEKR